MTIIFAGHVRSVGTGTTPGGVRLTIQPEVRRELESLTLEAFKGEADAYKPGQQVEVRIVPISLEYAYITPYEAAFVQIAEALGYKGEIWLADKVIETVKAQRDRLAALNVAIGR